LNINKYQKQSDCFYKGEKYSVRDNGAVFRHAGINKSLRKLDNFWTFGKPNAKGYLVFASEVVHRIVAFAFLGLPPTPQHIVDHIDTNRQNNRPENLRWLTKLENILNNPITLKKIELVCGSIEAFLKDPSILRNHDGVSRNFDWMRTVSPEEAKASWERLSNWAKSEYSSPKVGSLGEWIYTPTKIAENEINPNENIHQDSISKRIEEILEEVELDTGISIEKFSSKGKKREYISARAYAAYKLRSEIGLSDQGIGELIGRSKSTVYTYLKNHRSYILDANWYSNK
jgi:hypothetical protein